MLASAMSAPRRPTVDTAVEQYFGMQPGMDRLNLLPRHDRKQGWIAPNMVYQLARAMMSPGVAAQGGDVSPEDAVNFGGNLVGAGIGASAAVPVKGHGIVGMAVKSERGGPPPGLLKRGLKGEPGYVYHATSMERLADIADSGKLKTHKPHEFTDQDMWPDGGLERRAYFGESPENLYSFAPEEGKPTALRVKKDAAPFKKESYTGDVFSQKPIAAKDIEYLGDDGAWHPLSKAKK